MKLLYLHAGLSVHVVRFPKHLAQQYHGLDRHTMSEFLQLFVLLAVQKIQELQEESILHEQDLLQLQGEYLEPHPHVE
ncbi:hypothetical protein HMPREF9244_01414 [Alloscardovia omnicolens F0580]|uniref:Uncharacterized protein n=1 Tax=Alloscardovia omnicolens F0580 TaxID=1321816 RepID=U1QR54_9BIFI|nr:hypothetical protein HMPREF9244_01414 [Alloscardovia omnicolens F0580]